MTEEDFKLCDGCANELVCSDTLRCSKALAPGPGSECDWLINAGKRERCRQPAIYTTDVHRFLCKEHGEHLARRFGCRLFPLDASKATTQNDKGDSR